MRQRSVRAVIWALLAAIGVPIWLVVSGLVGAILNRRHFRSQDGVFKIATRPGDATKWSRLGTGYARCVSNVLVINVGLALVRTRIHEVRDVSLLELAGTQPKGLSVPVGRTLGISDGSRLDVAAEAEHSRDLDSLAGA